MGNGMCCTIDVETQTQTFSSPPPICPPSSRLGCLTLNHMVIMWLVGFIVMMFIFPPRCHGFSESNSLLTYSQKIGNALNVSDCWVCHQMPLDSHTGMPFEVVPLNSAELAKPYRKDNSTGWSWIKSEPSTWGYYRIGQKVGQWCWQCNETAGPRVGTSKCEVNIKINGACINGSWVAGYTLLNQSISGYYASWTMSISCKRSFPALKGHYFICGIRAYAILPENWSGNCYVATILPAMTIRNELPEGKIRNYRDLEESRQLVKDYAPMRHWRGHRGLLNAVYRLQAVVEIMANETGEALLALAKEQKEIRKMVLQNRLALDTM
ncbi:endogenous retrovirus group 3 member 1 Env polyprotein-like [Sceloporus undulatus]|uniref:endogenous retrovirus group 3 member 1 Env polyprotein-like n=1 Tax=Sceloporus undulatus TaxID=8520 RepID=UPI001C4CC184|nr:endogenous retrovirus group 3 member 1 Env polyprotein-like [Sceloporus undulatus]